MADPRQRTTHRHASVKIKAGSALDRLTAGRNFTDTVHEVFEMYARAGGGLTVEVVTPTTPQSQIQVEPKPEPQLRAAPERVEELSARMAAPEIDLTQMRFEVPDPESGLLVEVGYDDAMRMLKEQCPAGLEPVLDQFMIAAEEGRFDNVAVVEPSPEEFDYETLA